MNFIEIDCPWCWERIELGIDSSAGDAELVEDCSVCCQPMLLKLRFAPGSDQPDVIVERENA